MRHYFYVSSDSSWRWDCHFTWSSEPREGLAACSAKGVPSFLSYFKTLSTGSPAPGIEPATFCSTVKCSTTKLILLILILKAENLIEWLQYKSQTWKKRQICYQNQTCHSILLLYLTHRNLSIFEQRTMSTIST